VHDLGPEEAVSRLIDHAVAIQASDLYLTSNENHVAVLARHLGIVRILTVLNLELGRRCLNAIKALAGMDVVEHRRPQDGRWLRHLPSGDKIDLRINTIPTLFGEDFTLRLLVRRPSFVNLENLGMELQDYHQLLNILASPSGLILVTGPTGSGKTTTLYACLGYLNNGLRKINTIEDPVEYAVDGIRQSQVNQQLDVDFPELLRSVLRQAPDIIMVGEIRDPLTAETAVRAANSGHLVLATLHAPIAAGAIQSMLSFGIPHHFLARPCAASSPSAWCGPCAPSARPRSTCLCIRKSSRRCNPGSSRARGSAFSPPWAATPVTRRVIPRAPASSRCWSSTPKCAR